MIEFVKTEEARDPGIIGMAKEIKEWCLHIDFGECPTKCPFFDLWSNECRLQGSDPVDWKLEEDAERENDEK